MSVRTACLTVFASLPFLFAPVELVAQTSQTFDLNPGWNAIHLTVTPTDPSTELVFAGLPVDQVVTYYPNRTPVQFIQDPNETPWKSPGWHRWLKLPADSPKRFLNDLYKVQAGQGYLVHATEAVSGWQLIGEAAPVRPHWQPNSFNLVGFQLDPINPPTFGDYFAGSAAHRQPLIYQLTGDHWQGIDNSAGTIIENGRAYWVFCEGGSDWQGPLSIQLPGPGNRLDFHNNTDVLRLTLANRGNSPLSVTLALQPPATFPLRLQLKGVDATRYLEPNLAALPDPVLQPGETRLLRLAVDRSGLQGLSDGVLVITTDLGTRQLLPLSASSTDTP